METPQFASVNSPRETRWLSKTGSSGGRRRNAGKGERSSPPPAEGRRVAAGAKQSEVHGFVGAISTVVATVVFLVWAYTPEAWLHRVGITYYPNKYWALAIPAYMMVAVVSVIGSYLALNFMTSTPPTSINTIFDEYTREPSRHEGLHKDSDRPIDPISDIRIDQINDLMFGKEA